MVRPLRRSAPQDDAGSVVFILSVLSVLSVPLAAQTLPLTPGLVITRSVRIEPGHYVLSITDTTAPVLLVRGNNITVDLSGVTIEGVPDRRAPDQFSGTAILIDGGKNVTLRGAHIRGFKVGIHARNSRGLTLEDNDVSHNWKPRLYSLVEHESLVDWLSYHHNEKNEWLRYGAGIYLDGVIGGEVRRNTARQGMNGLLLTRSSRLRIWNNDFSYLSGLGIGLYRSTHNTIMHNRVDWCVRGYSHGFFNRGQDSAALLMFEQSSNNVVAYNSMTHGGDGLFLWAGQYTMDTGKGGSNDNLFYANDFSHAPTNAMEATFSRNRFIGNRAWESAHGLWGGYGWESEIVRNDFQDNRIGIAIEHGQKNRIAENTFLRDSTAIRLWWNMLEPSDWGYPKHRDTRSRDYLVWGNHFRKNRVGIRAQGTAKVEFAGNDQRDVDSLLVLANDTTRFVSDASLGPPHGEGQGGFRSDVERARREAPAIAGGVDALIPIHGFRGRATIIIDEWGPYDWRSPRLWPAGRSDANPLPLRVLGPRGTWRLVTATGASVSDSAGTVGDTVTVTTGSAGNVDWRVVLEYTGDTVVTPQGDTVPAGTPFRFDYSRFEPRIDWRARIVTWDSTSDPRTDSAAFATRLAGAATAELQPPRIDWMWFRPAVKEVPLARWAMRAEGGVDLPPGAFVLRAISDDGIRVWVDDRLVIDHWAAHESAVDEVKLEGGPSRRLRVEYYQVDGWTEVRVEVVRSEE